MEFLMPAPIKTELKAAKFSLAAASKAAGARSTSERKQVAENIY